jgi:probable phosphoglycerate mutase
MKLYFVRHGESVANLRREFSNSGIKHPLTEKGSEQARALSQKLSGIPFEIIYSSPILRAVQTAQILAEQLHAPMETTEALREWSVGIYEGTTDKEGWELHRQVQEDWFFKNKPESKMPGGESFLEIRERFVPFIDQLTQNDTEQNILCVAHGGLYLAMLPVIFKNIDLPFANEHGFPYTSCTIAEARAEGIYCTTWCDIPQKGLFTAKTRRNK